MLEAEPAPLPAGDQQHRHLAAPQRLLALPPGLGRIGIRPDDGHRPDALRRRHGERVVAPGVQFPQLSQVEAAKLIEQPAALLVGQAIPPGEDVLLARLVQALPQVVGDGDHGMTPSELERESIIR